MRIDRVFTRQVMATTPEATLAEAACTMQGYRLGTLLVMDGQGTASRPVGIITDRDVALRGFASDTSRVASAMTPVVATVRADADVHEAIALMQAHGVRRLIVTAEDGAVCGIVSIDDVIDGLSAELAAAASVLKGELKRDAAGLGHVIV
jgi:CBS domain-containing protein